MPFVQDELVVITPLQLHLSRRLTINDIFAATSIGRIPILFPGHAQKLSMGLGVENLCGCNDQTLAIINQAAALEVWKWDKQSRGALSIGELYQKGTNILAGLWDGNGIVEGFGPIIAEIYRCAAAIYINVIISGTSANWTILILGAFTGIDELQKAVRFLATSSQLLLPHTDALRLICWPIMIGPQPPSPH